MSRHESRVAIIEKALKGTTLSTWAESAREELAEEILDELDRFDMTLGPSEAVSPHLKVPPIGDERTRRIVEALVKSGPATLHGVFGVIHNFKVAGPWTPHRPAKSTSPEETPPKFQYTWFRVHSKAGDMLAQAGPKGWFFHGEHHAANGIVDSMDIVDSILQQEGWILVPGEGTP